MSRVDDVIYNFICTHGCAGLNEDSKKLLSDAVRYGFEQGESFGKYGAFIEKQNEKMAEAIIQPENDRVWKEKLDGIMKHTDNLPYALQTVELLGLIAEILLVRKNGG